MTQDLNTFAAGLYDETERDAETLAFLGGGVFVRKLRIPPPPPGVFSLLEICGSPFLQGVEAEQIHIEDLYLALRIMTEREKAVSSKINFKKMSKKIGKLSIGDALDAVRFVQDLFDFVYRGFDLLPPSNEPANKPVGERIFDAEWLAGIVAKVHGITGRTDFEIIWRIPLCSVGFYIAQYAKENGVKNVGRQPDEIKLLEFIKQKRETLKNG